MAETPALPRRHVVQLGAAAAAGIVATKAAAQRLPSPAPVDVGQVQNGAIRFPPWTAPTERPSGGPPIPTPPTGRVGFAVVGLGRLALEEILPAFGEAKRARLAALVSGSPDKAGSVAAQYGVSPASVHDYQGFEGLRDNPDVQVVYVALPNAMHREFTERAAAIGKHVLCEKPMATSVADAEAMVAACRQAGRKLMIAYRCQYEPNNREVLRMVRSQTLGRIGFINATNLQNMGDPTQWRLRRALAGGGALPDIGLYCLNAARFLTGEEPVELSARVSSPAGDARFTEVEETIDFSLRFPSGVIASCASSYGMHESRLLRVHGPGGWIDLENAFAYEGQILRVARRDGAAESLDTRRLSMRNQFAVELDHMAECVRTDRRPHTPGEEGLQDQRLMEALYRAAATGQRVTLAPVAGLDTTRGPSPEAA